MRPKGEDLLRYTHAHTSILLLKLKQGTKNLQVKGNHMSQILEVLTTVDDSLLDHYLHYLLDKK